MEATFNSSVLPTPCKSQQWIFNTSSHPSIPFRFHAALDLWFTNRFFCGHLSPFSPSAAHPRDTRRWRDRRQTFGHFTPRSKALSHNDVCSINVGWMKWSWVSPRCPLRKVQIPPSVCRALYNPVPGSLYSLPCSCSLIMAALQTTAPSFFPTWSLQFTLTMDVLPMRHLLPTTLFPLWPSASPLWRP